MYEILIVDDEHTVVENLSVTISWETIDVHSVHKAFDAHEALAILAENSIDIVLTDIKMPGMSGLDLIAEIKRRWKKTKCILLTGYADFEYAKQALQMDTFDYLLKPISNDKVLEAVRRSVDMLREEYEVLTSTQQALAAVKESLPLLRQNMLTELLSGQRPDPDKLHERLSMLQLPLQVNDRFMMMLVRPEEGFRNYDYLQHPLLEFALHNITQELFGDSLVCWYCRDVHDYMVYILFERKTDRSEEQDPVSDQQTAWIERTALQLQHSVKTYLKGRISVLVGDWGQFPDDLPDLYQRCLTVLRRRVGHEQCFFITLQDEPSVNKIHVLQGLYEPPGLIHLLEAGNWHRFEQKLDRVFTEMEQADTVAQEHLAEVHYAVANAFLYIVHKNGRYLEEMSLRAGQTDFHQVFQSVGQLKEWTRSTLLMIRDDMDREEDSNRSAIVRKVQMYVQQHLEEDMSVQMIADSIYLHPNYLSKIYKLETGEGLSDYILRMRMERAVHLLGQPQNKIHEIATRLGYQNPSYFIRLFKKVYEMTPQEYRNRHLPS